MIATPRMQLDNGDNVNCTDDSSVIEDVLTSEPPDSSGFRSSMTVLRASRQMVVFLPQSLAQRLRNTASMPLGNGW